MAVKRFPPAALFKKRIFIENGILDSLSSIRIINHQLLSALHAFKENVVHRFTSTETLSGWRSNGNPGKLLAFVADSGNDRDPSTGSG